MANPFEETMIAGDVSLTPHDRVQQERDLRIGETANMYMNTGATNPTEEATRYVDWKYPTVFEDLTPGKSGHPYEGGWGPEHKWAASTNLGYNPLKHILSTYAHKVEPAIRDVMGFPQPSWVDEYTDRDIPNRFDLIQNLIEKENKKIDQIQMNPLWPAPGPWNEFDPHSRFEEYIDNMNIDEGGTEWSPSEEYLGGTTELAQSQWRRPENVEKTIDVLEIRPEFEGWTRDEIKAHIFRSAKQANRGGIIGLNGGGTIHKDSRTPLPDDLRDQMYDWILQQMMRQRQEEMQEQWERDRNPMLYPPPIPEGGMEV